jgi:hypothetical protein
MYKGPNKIIGATLGGNHYLISNCDYVKNLDELVQQ